MGRSDLIVGCFDFRHLKLVMLKRQDTKFKVVYNRLGNVNVTHSRYKVVYNRLSNVTHSRHKVTVIYNRLSNQWGLNKTFQEQQGMIC